MLPPPSKATSSNALKHSLTIVVIWASVIVETFDCGSCTPITFDSPTLVVVDNDDTDAGVRVGHEIGDNVDAEHAVGGIDGVEILFVVSDIAGIDGDGIGPDVVDIEILGPKEIVLICDVAARLQRPGRASSCSEGAADPAVFSRLLRGLTHVASTAACPESPLAVRRPLPVGSVSCSPTLASTSRWDLDR